MPDASDATTVRDHLIELGSGYSRPGRSLSKLVGLAEAELGHTRILAAAPGSKVSGPAFLGCLIVISEDSVYVFTDGGAEPPLHFDDQVSVGQRGRATVVWSRTGEIEFESPHTDHLVQVLARRGAELRELPQLRRDARADSQKDRRRVTLGAPLSLTVGDCVVLGGSGPWDLAVGDPVIMSFADHALTVGWKEALIGPTPYHLLRGLELGGPGHVESGGGFAGGGFGVEGAALGIAAASLLNSFTTRQSIQTSIRIEFGSGELFLHHTRWAPGALRIMLSEVFMAMRPAS